MKEQVTSLHAPVAIGPYSQAIKAGDTMYISGQLPMDVATGEFSSADIVLQTEQVLLNLKAILHEGGYEIGDVVKTTVYLKNLADFTVMNEVYQNHFTRPYPARATFEVSRLPKDALVEIEAVAYKKCEITP